ncbi:MAG: GIY-YIG nuclease family protein [Patescibacteria group bacterium]|nr:GIY-YIG nuclease family protein [Patescibacteria group bacterium]
MRYYVYALQSLKNDQLYIGISNNPDNRLKEHNAGTTKSTKGFRPFIKIYQEQCSSRIDARNKEKYYKSSCGREFLKQFKKIIPR